MYISRCFLHINSAFISDIKKFRSLWNILYPQPRKLCPREMKVQDGTLGSVETYPNVE
jgi:hypothetical protein